jgi:SAM-dependent methyltransferase
MKAYYEARALEYDDWWLGIGTFTGRERPGWDEARGELERWIADLQPARTLDIACGTGFMTRHLRGEVVGFDQSTSMIELARERVPDADFVQGDALDLPFDDEAFDRIFTSYFYCHLEEEDRRRFLDEARRVAGELVVVASVPGRNDRLERWEERKLSDGSRWQVYKRVFHPDDLAKELDGRVLHVNRYFVMVVTP